MTWKRVKNGCVTALKVAALMLGLLVFTSAMIGASMYVGEGLFFGVLFGGAITFFVLFVLFHIISALVLR